MPFSISMSNAELRRQIHIQSEQKRRAQIKDGFEELKKHLPGCQNKKMSKAAMLTRSTSLTRSLLRFTVPFTNPHA
jgi:Helix-loop-helix DNA-binding domain